MKEQKQSYLKRLIKGDIPLSITFWIWFVFFSLILLVFIDFKYSSYEENKTTFELFLNFTFYIFTIIYSIFIFIAVIRSANKYKKSTFFSFLAKLAVTINLTFTLFTLMDIVKSSFYEDYALSERIETFKQSLPLRINTFLVLNDIQKDGKVIRYKYNFVKENIFKDKKIKFSSFKKRIQDSICYDESKLEFLKKDYSYKHEYYEKDKKLFKEIFTSKESCGPGIYDLDILTELLNVKKEI